MEKHSRNITAALIALAAASCLPAQQITANRSNKPAGPVEVLVIESKIPGAELVTDGFTVSIRNTGIKTIAAYTTRQRSTSADGRPFLDDSTMIDKLAPGDSRALSLEAHPGSSVELDSVVYADGTSEGADEAGTVERIRTRVTPPRAGPEAVTLPPNAYTYGFIVYYNCYPSTCVQTETAAGSFSVTAQMSGVLSNLARERHAVADGEMMTATNCQIPVTLTVFIGTQYDSTYGFGISLTGEAAQVGVVTLEDQIVWYYAKKTRIGQAASGCA